MTTLEVYIEERLENQIINSVNWLHGPFDLSGVSSIKQYNYKKN